MLEELVPEYYRDFDDMFSKEKANQLSTHKEYNHAIDLTPDAKSFCSKVYLMSLHKQDTLKAFIVKNKQKGYIWESKLPMASPVFYIKKKDNLLHLVQGY